MRKAQWVAEVKNSLQVSVIDVPMPEWVEEDFVKNSSYRIFDKIWCLTETSYKIFGQYQQKTLMEWDYVDREIFNHNTAKKRGSEIAFYHQASLNPSFSQKNTSKVIRAFQMFSEECPDSVRLTITGVLSEEQMALAKKSKNIILIPDVIDRRSIADIYSKSDCVICPSTREGLGLSFFEAKSSGCSIITTDVDPMNRHTEYLCEVISYNKSESMVPHAITSAEKIFEQLKVNQEY